MSYPMASIQAAVGSRTARAGAGPLPWWRSGGVSPAICIAAWQPKGAASLAASYINLANPGTYDCTEGAAPAWAAATGWTGDRYDYLKTGIIPTANYTVIVRHSGSDTSRGGLFGCTPLFMIRRSGTPAKVEYYISGVSITGGNWAVSGTYGLNNKYGYKDGIKDTAAFVGTDNPTVEMYLMSWNNNGTVTDMLGGAILAAAVYSSPLTDAQYLAVHTAMMAL